MFVLIAILAAIAVGLFSFSVRTKQAAYLSSASMMLAVLSGALAFFLLFLYV